MNAQIEKDMTMRYSVAANIPPTFASNEVPPASQADILNKRVRSPPPVSMRTRNNGDYIHPPTRTQSTPPAALRQPLSRRPSREAIQSYPSIVKQGSLSRQPSGEAIQGYPPVAEDYRGCAPVSPDNAPSESQAVCGLFHRIGIISKAQLGCAARSPQWNMLGEFIA
ncbi:uncharacterized protein PG998_010787 [Apiospora kogelbergensis]|uniref:uncharacterized protein n=1 Tax=Apiospora kogelbergensis TaxID=1337665 RepID=UPI00312E606D